MQLRFIWLQRIPEWHDFQKLMSKEIHQIDKILNELWMYSTKYTHV